MNDLELGTDVVEGDESAIDNLIGGLERAITNRDYRSNAKVIAAHLSRVFGVSALPIPTRGQAFLDAADPAALEAAPSDDLAVIYETLLSTAQALRNGVEYTAGTVHIGQRTVVVHNAEIAPYLCEHYSSGRIHEIRTFLSTKGTFSAKTNPRLGLVRTSEADENPDMGARQWVTDSVMCGYWQRAVDPAGWKQALLVNAAFALSPSSVRAVEETIADPAWFRTLKSDGEVDETRGMPHIFLPESVELDQTSGTPRPESILCDPEWHNQKRLESQALLLWALVNSITGGLVRGDPDGLSLGDLKCPVRRSIVLRAIDSLAAYLVSVNRDPNAPQRFDCLAPSAGSWEERAHIGGMTWDTAITGLAIERLIDLLENRAYDGAPGMREIRAEIAAAPYAATRPCHAMQMLTKQARETVRERVVAPLVAGGNARQSAERSSDTSLAFLAATGIELAKDPLENATLYLKLYDQLSRDLVRDHGMLRYGKETIHSGGRAYTVVDSYLGIGFWLPESLRDVLIHGRSPQGRRSWGSTDTSSLEALLARQQNAVDNTEAGWTLGLTAAVQGLSSLLLQVRRSARNSTCFYETERNLEVALGNYITRSLATITGARSDGSFWLKSNGRPVAPFTVMEAYEFIPSIRTGGSTAVPGAHPLSWSMAQLFDGLSKAEAALSRPA